MPGPRIHPRGLLNRVADWLMKRPELKSEFKILLDRYLRDGSSSHAEMGNIMDAFIFDYRLPDSRTPLRYFLDEADLSSKDHRDFQTLEDSTMSIFEVKEVYRGRGIKMRDIMSNRDYSVKERRGTYELEPGNLVICRVAPFGSQSVIVTPAPAVLPREATFYMKRKLKPSRYVSEKEGLDAFDLLDLGKESDIRPQTLDEIKKALKKKLVSLGIGIDFRGLSRRVNQNKDVEKAFPEVYEFDFPSNADFEETIGLLELLWKSYPRKDLGGKSLEEAFPIGPRERILASELLEEVVEKVNMLDYSSQEEVEGAIDRLRDNWLRTPLRDFGGKTPMEVILEERRELGNPREDIHYIVRPSLIKDYDLNKSERLYMEGVRAFKAGGLMKAAELFEEVVEMYPDNYEAWGNLGKCCALMGYKKKAIKCYKRALSVAPDYDCARNDLEFIMGQKEEDLATMGFLGALMSFALRLNRKGSEETDVWKEFAKIEKEAREGT
ncbi:MAG: tetratricopeptide repeat protein [Thermoplasmata archaeon]